MSGKLKRMWPAAAASLLALSSVAQANNGTSGDMSRAKQRPNSMNAQNGQHVAQVINPPARPIVKDGFDVFLDGEFLWWRPSLDDNQFAAACGFCPADVETVNGVPSPLLNTYGMTVLSPDYKMDAGFRIGVGYNMPYDGWDVYLRWTRFHTTASRCAPCQPCCDYYTCDLGCESECNSCDFDDCDSCETPSCNSCEVSSCETSCEVECCEYTCAPTPCEQPCNPCDLPDCMQTMIIAGVPCRGSFDNFGQICEASTEWKIRLDLLDLELGREFFVSRKLTLRPFIGLRQAWIDMSQNVFFSSNIAFPLGTNLSFYTLTDTLVAAKNENIYLKNRFRGLGPRAGLNSRWLIGGDVSVVGEAAFSILYGHYTVESNCCTCINGEILPAGLDASDIRPSNLQDTFWTSKGVADLGIGFEWSRSFSEDRWGLAIALLWDNSLYFNQNQQIGIEEFSAPQVEVGSPEVLKLPLTQASLSARRHGDFSTQGLTVRASLDF